MPINTCWNCVCGMKLLPMKMIKTQLTNHLGESCLSYLMKIAMESPEKKILSDDLDKIIDIWNRKPRRIVVSIIVTLIITSYHYSSIFLKSPRGGGGFKCPPSPPEKKPLCIILLVNTIGHTCIICTHYGNVIIYSPSASLFSPLFIHVHTIVHVHTMVML